MFKAVPVSGVGDACLSTHLLNLANIGARLVDNIHIEKNIFEIYLDSSGSGDILRRGRLGGGLEQWSMPPLTQQARGLEDHAGGG